VATSSGGSWRWVGIALLIVALIFAGITIGFRRQRSGDKEHVNH